MSILPAQRLAQLDEYFFARANRLISQVEKSHRKVLNLGIGSPDLPPPVAAITELKKELDVTTNHRYPMYRGETVLRQAIAKYYARRFSVELDPETEVLPLNGSKEGITHVSLAFLNAGDEVLVPDPGYPAYSAAATLAQALPRHFALTKEHGWFPNLKELEQMDLRKVKMWWLNYPNNPAGVQANREQLESWVEFAKRHSILIVFDNPYSDVFWGQKPASILEVPGAKDVCIELNSLSKTLNIAGWRVGMALAKPEFITALIQVKSNIDTGSFAAVQRAAAFALDQTSDEWIAQRNHIYQRRRELLCDGLEHIGFLPQPADASLYVWAEVPAVRGLVEGLCLQMIKSQQVFITPGTAFGKNGEGYVRFSLCISEELLKEGLKRIQMFLGV